MNNENPTKEMLLDLIIRSDQLDQIKQPENNNFKRVTIFNHQVALSILQKNCFSGLKMPFAELGLEFGSKEQDELQEIFEQAGYKVSVQKNSGYGYYFEILRG